IVWATTRQASSQVAFGTTESYGQVAVGPEGALHFVNLSGLIPSTTYHFQVQSVDTNGNIARSTDLMFLTSAIVFPPDLSITKTASSTTVTSGGTVTFTITVTNAAGTADELAVLV